MNAAIVSVQSVLSDRLHVIIDHLKVNLGVITYLYRLVQELFQTPLFCQSLVDLFPCAVLVRIHFTFPVLCSAALSVHKTLGTVDDRTDASGNVQIALCTCITALFGKCHAVMTSVVKGITCCDHRLTGQISNSLNTKTAGDHNYILCTFRQQIL